MIVSPRVRAFRRRRTNDPSGHALKLPDRNTRAEAWYEADPAADKTSIADEQTGVRYRLCHQRISEFSSQPADARRNRLLSHVADRSRDRVSPK